MINCKMFFLLLVFAYLRKALKGCMDVETKTVHKFDIELLVVCNEAQTFAVCNMRGKDSS